MTEEDYKKSFAKIEQKKQNKMADFLQETPLFHQMQRKLVLKFIRFIKKVKTIRN